MRLLPILLLCACWSPKSTGSHSMIGMILDADGEPVRGLTVQTVEAQWVTDDEGRFAVNYKEPSQYLHFEYEGMWYRRYYQPGIDDDKTITLQLPAAAPRHVRCMHDPCDTTLVFSLGDAFTATARGRCDDENRTPIVMPVDKIMPEATCRASTTAKDEVIYPAYKLDKLQLSGPPALLTVDLFTTTPTLPKQCQVRIDGKPATPATGSTYTAEVFGRVQYDGVCDGIPATPATAYVVGAGKVDLAWSPVAPTLKVDAIADWATEIVVVRHAPQGNWWQLTLPVKDGVATLPPLKAGTYKFGFNATEGQVRHLKIREAVAPGRLQMVDVPTDPPGEHPVYVGAVVLESDFTQGALPMDLLATE